MNKADRKTLEALDTVAVLKAARRSGREGVRAVFAAFAAYAVAASQRGTFRVPGIVAGDVECKPLPKRATLRSDEHAAIEAVTAATAEAVATLARKGDGAGIVALVWSDFARRTVRRHDAQQPWCVPGVLAVEWADTRDDAETAARRKAASR